MSPELALADVTGEAALATALGPILVASDGTDSATAALRATAQLARHTDSRVLVLGVLEVLPLAAADYGLLIPPVDTEEARREELFERIKRQVAEVAGEATGWTIELREGDPAAMIAKAARESGARLLVTGLGKHDLLDRIFGGETALHALRRSRVPLLAVAPSFTHLPLRAVVCTDFSAGSVQAARTALSLFDTVKVVYLLHVAPRLETQPEAFAAWMNLYGEGVTPAFERIRAELGLPSGVTVETVTRQGKPSKEVLDFAKSVDVDLIVTGSRGAGLVDRILVGSTATGLIRGSHRTILAVPVTPSEEHRIAVAEGRRTELPREAWATELAAFTRRNAGRRASLEVDDPELGAQAQEHDYPFLGAAYDHHDERVELMLGDFVGVRRHLTRGIANVQSLDILRDEHGRDWILRISHGDGQTILTLAR